MIRNLLTNEFSTRSALTFYDRFGHNKDESYFLYIADPTAAKNSLNTDSDSTSTTGEIIAQPLNTLAETINTVNDVIWARQIYQKNAALVVSRIDWVAETLYDIHDDLVDMENKKFYVVTDDLNVYKCISNNDGGASTVKPSATTTEEQITTDGYVWKFLYKIRESMEFFLTTHGGYFGNGWMPVEILPSTIPSLDSRILQLNVELDAIHGQIDHVEVNDAGSAYSDSVVYSESSSNTNSTDGTDGTDSTATGTHTTQTDIQAGKNTLVTNTDAGMKEIVDYYNDAFVVYIRTGTGKGQVRTITDYKPNGTLTLDSAWTYDVPAGSSYEILPRVVIDGNGSGAIVLPDIDISTKNIIGFDILDGGINYTNASVVVYRRGLTDQGKNSTTASVTISPLGGHGKNVVWELGTKAVMVSAELDAKQKSTPSLRYLPDTRYKQIGLVSNLRKSSPITGVNSSDIIGIDVEEQTVELGLENEYKRQTVYFNRCEYLVQNTDGAVSDLSISDFTIGSVVKQGQNGTLGQARGLVRKWTLESVAVGGAIGGCGCDELGSAGEYTTIGMLEIDVLQSEFKACGVTNFKIVREDWPVYPTTDDTDNTEGTPSSYVDSTYAHRITSSTTVASYDDDTFPRGGYVLGNDSKQVGLITSWESSDAGNSGKLIIDTISTSSSSGWLEPSHDSLGAVIEGEHIFYFAGLDASTGGLNTNNGQVINSGRITSIKTLQDTSIQPLAVCGTHTLDIGLIGGFSNTIKFNIGDRVAQVRLDDTTYLGYEVIAEGTVVNFDADVDDNKNFEAATGNGILELTDVTGQFLEDDTNQSYSLITTSTGGLFPFSSKGSITVPVYDIKYPDFNKNYGMNVLYIQNMEQVSRATAQTDTFRLVVEF